MSFESQTQLPEESAMHAGPHCSLAAPSNNSSAAYPLASSWALPPSEAPGNLGTLGASVEPIPSHLQYLVLLPCVDTWKIRCSCGGPWSSVEQKESHFLDHLCLLFLPTQWRLQQSAVSDHRFYTVLK